MKTLSRSTGLKIAAVLSFLLGAFGVIATLPLIAQGAVAVNQSHDAPPFVVLMLGVITGVVAIVAAYGAWKGQTWGIVLTIVANLVNGLSAAPGLLFAPNSFLRTLATVTVVLTVAIIVLCLRRERMPALA